jgi:hypothetical protein
MLDKLHQPSVVESVVKPPDVGIEHPVHLLRSDSDSQRIQRLMRAAPRSKSIREAQESPVRRSRSTLRRWPAGRSCLPAWERRAGEARPVYPPSGCTLCAQVCPVRSSLEPMGEIVEVFLKSLSVVLPRLAVYARCRAPLDFQVRCSQPLHVIDVVQERGEPLFLILLCCLTYPLKRAGRTFPALSPECVALGRVPLGQSPSLHRLRSRFLGLVRRLRRYFGNCPTSRVRSSSAYVLRLPDAVCGSLFRRRTRDLPVPAQGVSAHARGL